MSSVEGWAPAAAEHVEEDVDGAAGLAAERARLGELGRIPQGRETDGTADSGSLEYRRSVMQAAGVGGEESDTAFS